MNRKELQIEWGKRMETERRAGFSYFLVLSLWGYFLGFPKVGKISFIEEGK